MPNGSSAERTFCGVMLSEAKHLNCCFRHRPAKGMQEAPALRALLFSLRLCVIFCLFLAFSFPLPLTTVN
jgi:hypothetical protein